MTLETKPFGDIITFTRAGEGGRFNALGQYEMVPADVPRLDHDPITLQPLGIRIEEQRTNLLLNSVLAGGTSGVVGSTAVAPTGWSFGAPTPGGEITFVTTSLGTSGVRFQATAQRPALARTVNVLANTTYSHHARITALTGTLEIQNVVWAPGAPAGATLSYWRNGATVAGNTLVSAGDHIAVIVAVGATAGTFSARFGPGVASPATCDCTMTLPQCEAGAAPSSYIPTTTAQVTRAADVCSVNALSPWYNPLEGTIVVEGIGRDGSGTPRSAASIGDNTSANRIQLRRVGVNQGGAIVSASGAEQADFTGSVNSWPLFVQCKAAISCAANNFAFSCNGEAAQIDNSGAVPSVNRLNIGSGAGVSTWNGTISRITYYPHALSAAEMQAITA